MNWTKSTEFAALADGYANAWKFENPTSYDRPSVLVGGSPDSGKSSLMLARYFLPALEAGTLIQHVNDPARSFGIACIVNAIFYGHRETLLIDDLVDPRFGLGITIIGISEHPDPVWRAAENAEYAAHFVENLKRMANDDEASLVTLYEWGTFGAMLVQNQPQRQEQGKIFVTLQPGTKPWQELYATCTNQEVKDKADYLSDMRRRSFTEFVKNVQATQRRLDRLRNSPHVMSRLWDPTQVLREAAQHGPVITIILGAKRAGIDPQAQRFIMGTWNIRHVQESSQLWVANGYPTPRQILCDETFQNGLAKTYEVGSIAEQRKEGVNWILGGTRVFTGDLDLDAELKHSTNEHIAMRCQGYDVAKEWVYDMLRVDSKRVKETRTTTKMIHDGYDERESVSRRIGAAGERAGGNIGTVSRPRYREVEESVNVYEATNDQILDAIMEQRSLDKGYYKQLAFGRVSGPHYQTLPEDVADGGGSDKVAEHVAWLRAHGVQRNAGANCTGSTPLAPAHRRSKKKKSAHVTNLVVPLAPSKIRRNSSVTALRL